MGGESGQVVWVFQLTFKKARNEYRLTSSIFIFFYFIFIFKNFNLPTKKWTNLNYAVFLRNHQYVLQIMNYWVRLMHFLLTEHSRKETFVKIVNVTKVSRLINAFVFMFYWKNVQIYSKVEYVFVIFSWSSKIKSCWYQNFKQTNVAIKKSFFRIEKKILLVLISPFQSRQSYLFLIPAYFTFEKVASEKEIYTFYK